MRRIPLVPTIIVALCVVIMIALGLWQLLVRLPEKEAYLAQLAANPARPPIAFPRQPDAMLLFRKSAGLCLDPVAIRIIGAGAKGFRAIADCRTGAEGPGMTVQLGTTRDVHAKVAWRGGEVAGYLTQAPDARPLLAGLWDNTPRRLMLVAMPAVAGLNANTPPDIDTVPNSHLAYAGQWFFFAAIATIIYTLAVRRRIIPPPSSRP